MAHIGVFGVDFLILLPFVLVGMTLVLRFAFKLKWLTAICLSILAATLLPVIRHVFGVGPGIVFLPVAGICAVALLIQFFRWLARGDVNTQVSAAERDRILKMVEQGKISSEESTELLDALGRANALRGQDRFSPADITMLVGVALVVLGFFLPWAYVGIEVPSLFGSRASAYQAGYHVGAIGWAVFIIAILSAVPVFVTPRDHLYKVSMLQIFLTLIGTVLVISLLIQAANNLGVGLVVCLAGFVVAIIGSAAKFRKLAG
ncbi:MAG: SHOCT-like domain-containing protein [Planctomycetota bacterium]|jgi:hypothetical protein